MSGVAIRHDHFRWERREFDNAALDIVLDLGRGPAVEGKLELGRIQLMERRKLARRLGRSALEIGVYSRLCALDSGRLVHHGGDRKRREAIRDRGHSEPIL